MKKITLLLMLFTSLLSAQTVEELFTKANKAYKEAKYNEAIEFYEKIEQKGKISSELYFNLGNCYYKLNKVAPTIYNYEQALQLNPLNKDAANNLVFAKRLTLDVIEELPKSFFQKLNQNYLQKLSYNQWAVVVVVFSFLASLFFLLFYFSIISARKKVYFITSFISFLFLIATLIITYNQYHFSKKNIQAIIFAEKVEVKNAPTLNSEDVFTLHEGTKVKVLDGVDNWKKIKLTDGKVGWIEKNKLKVFKIF